MDVTRLILLAISCLMVVLVVRALVGTVGRPPREHQRLVADPSGDEWMGVDELAQRLETKRSEVIALVDRDAIPFWVGVRSRRSDPRTYWFRRDEIDEWTVG